MLAELLDRESFCGKRKMRKANRLFTSYLLSKMGARGNSSNSALWGRCGSDVIEIYRLSIEELQEKHQHCLCNVLCQSTKATFMLNMNQDGKKIYFPSVNSFFLQLSVLLNCRRFFWKNKFSFFIILAGERGEGRVWGEANKKSPFNIKYTTQISFLFPRCASYVLLGFSSRRGCENIIAWHVSTSRRAAGTGGDLKAEHDAILKYSI